MLVRYVVIRNLNRCCRWSVDVLNVAALMAGLIAVFGNLIVSAYPVLTSRAIHNAGAYTMFMAAVLYMTLETGLTCCLCPEYYAKSMVWGFRELLISSVGEWFLVSVFLAFFLTFAHEFRRVIVTVDVFPLVCHMDEHIEVTRLRPHDSYSLFSSASL
ncbi:hypothetical protein HPB52_021054 [Rhipicephalus sanguineus]|uniref:CWH43-like N-terminal domain-containing protein n=1 Tax=Rhipicephalus sanguineus TaxID=34632 RepID=A0A9D4T4N3_RHISA|nr:hypothetical protein HPB52_021054 [Rhipicephalus sanguineus]